MKYCCTECNNGYEDRTGKRPMIDMTNGHTTCEKCCNNQIVAGKEVKLNKLVIQLISENNPNIKCPFCKYSFDTEKRIPQCVKICGDTICNTCLTILTTRTENSLVFRCPFDGLISIDEEKHHISVKNKIFEQALRQREAINRWSEAEEINNNKWYNAKTLAVVNKIDNKKEKTGLVTGKELNEQIEKAYQDNKELKEYIKRIEQSYTLFEQDHMTEQLERLKRKAAKIKDGYEIGKDNRKIGQIERSVWAFLNSFRYDQQKEINKQVKEINEFVPVSNRKEPIERFRDIIAKNQLLCLLEKKLKKKRTKRDIKKFQSNLYMIKKIREQEMSSIITSAKEVFKLFTEIKDVGDEIKKRRDVIINDSFNALVFGNKNNYFPDIKSRTDSHLKKSKRIHKKERQF